MGSHFDIICASASICFIALTWLGPRYLGIWGLLIAQFLVFVGCFILLIPGIADAEDGAIGLLFLLAVVFVLNCLLFPVALLAMWRRRKVAERRVLRLMDELRAMGPGPASE